MRISGRGRGWGADGSDGATPRRWLDDGDAEGRREAKPQVAWWLAIQGAAAGVEETVEQDEEEEEGNEDEEESRQGGGGRYSLPRDASADVSTRDDQVAQVSLTREQARGRSEV